LRSAGVSSVVAGLRDVAEVRAAVANMTSELPSALWSELDRIAVGT
jgi:hypothetical protein